MFFNMFNLLLARKNTFLNCFLWINLDLLQVTPALWNFGGEALTHVERHKKKKVKDTVKSELQGEVSKAVIIVCFGLGPSNQGNSTTGLTLCPVATMACTAEKPHSN